MEITTDMITQYGLMNKVSTGHAMLDVLVCLAIPILLKTWMPRLYEYVQNYFFPQVAEVVQFTRRIEFNQKPSQYWYWGSSNNDEPPNNLLQKAILAYLNKDPDVAGQLAHANVDLAEKPAKAKGRISEAGGDDDDYESDSDNGEDQVHSFGVSIAPPFEDWIRIEPGLYFMRSEETTTEEDRDKRKTKTIFFFKSNRPDGNKLIDDYINRAFAYYQDQRKQKTDTARYMYMPLSKGGGESSGEDAAKSDGTIYKRYKLSEDKTFASLFHPERDHILKVIEDFKHRRGKFAIPGYPQKLGFLLHGPPGTGKTTFIKALAQATGRHIVSVPLAKIRTNQELTDVMFEQLYRIEGQDMPVSMNFSKVLFVMEDVDAACRVVQKRSPDPVQTTLTTVKKYSKDGSLVKTTSKMEQILPADQDDSNDEDELDEDAMQAIAEEMSSQKGKKSKKGKKGKKNQGEDIEAEDDSEGPKLVEKKDNKGKGKNPINSQFWGRQAPMDELNLAGLLNVLDGVVDTPDRLVVMTTNHPEKLDPALVRPGRINKKIFMGRMKVHEALQMVRHYFADVSAADEVAVRGVFVDEKWSPAELESMCAEYDSVRELVEALAVQVASC